MNNLEAMNEVVDFMKKCGAFYVASFDGESTRVRPFGIAEVYDDHIYIQTGKVKDAYKQIMAYPNCEICCFDGKQWLRISGKLIDDDRVEAKKALLDKNPTLRKIGYDENDGNTAILYFEKPTAIFYSFADGGKPRVVLE